MVSLFGWGSGSSDAKPSSTPDKTPSIQNDDPSPPSTLSQPPQTQPPAPKDNRNLKLFFGGMAFFSFSLWVTRRAHIKKRIACTPPFYTSSTYHQPNVSGAAEALEALNLATINVLSFGMMSSGAALYALDINNLEDARRIMRAGIEGGTPSKSDEELEQDVTEWVTKMLGDRFQKQLETERAKKQLEVAKAESKEKGN
ncbi:hypothetical protein N7492_007639 [Penicillium capsulatum]|uniref:Altered inheritance of mitochondria protein 11 n=1 Tax=Penicillium capsulatum TaxID=69766 RepID=A0A9W9I085_9EURO|nr:hypothetical protein N7492_007639 [Penicillium capsulatum]KAJ6117473.1 hypothetical protein N7512_007198 [Penicillium capsulatum]